uniref:Uncharacterized protein n=1 Tax=Cannabis sativa TaxID=3483 RepID=A0A803QRF2_CANSA
ATLGACPRLFLHVHVARNRNSRPHVATHAPAREWASLPSEPPQLKVVSATFHVAFARVHMQPMRG